MSRRPWILVLYLLTVSVAAFLVPERTAGVCLLLLFGVQFALLAFAGKLDWNSLWPIWRLRVLFFFLLLCYTLLPQGTENEVSWETGLPGLYIHPDGFRIGLIMCGQIALVVLTSYVVRTISDPGSLVRGLRAFRLPDLLAYSLDATLELLDGSGQRQRGMGGGGGGGRGRGGGGGRHRQNGHEAEEQAEEKYGVLDAIRRRELAPFLNRIRRSLEQSKERALDSGLAPNLAHDVAVIAGIAAVMMSFKLLKVLPGIAFASGHKAIFYFPLYILASELTHSRWGGTTAGTIMGIIGFLNGDGRYGIFEILKHIAPGVCVDLLWPVFRRLPRAVWLYVVLGLVVAVARTSTEFGLLLALGAKGEVYLFPAFKLVPNLIAGVLSGFVTFAVIRAMVDPPMESDPAGPARPERNAEVVVDGPERRHPISQSEEWVKLEPVASEGVPNEAVVNISQNEGLATAAIHATQQDTGTGLLTAERPKVVTSIIKQGEGHRTHIESALMRESLVSKRIARQTDTEDELEILPDVNVISLGGQSLLDRGKGALLPLLDAVVECRKKHKIILGVGGGARLRHTYHICLDLGIPTGGLAMVAGAVDEQNTRMLQSLLAKHKGIALNKDHFLDLPLWLESGMIPIMTGMPPYHYWEPPSGKNRVPQNGQDLGIFMISEVLGARSMIFLKDEDGLYTDNPKTNPKAEFIPRIGVAELIHRRLPDLIIEHAVLEAMRNARHTRQVQIVNGLKPELLSRALDGEHVGTILDADA